MELVCEKYKEKMVAEKAFCSHPHDYCKFRSSCLIHFIGREGGNDDGQENDFEKDDFDSSAKD